MGVCFPPLTIELLNTNVLMILLFYQEKFYQSRISRGVINNNDLGLYVFASKPSSGAAIFKF